MKTFQTYYSQQSVRFLFPNPKFANSVKPLGFVIKSNNKVSCSLSMFKICVAQYTVFQSFVSPQEKCLSNNICVN